MMSRKEDEASIKDVLFIAALVFFAVVAAALADVAWHWILRLGGVH